MEDIEIVSGRPARRLDIDVRLLFVHLGLFVTVAIWGGNIVAIKYLNGYLSPIEVVLVRLTFTAALFLPVLMAAGGIPRLPRPVWRMLGLTGSLGIVCSQVAVTIGTDYLSAALASVLANTTAIFTAVVSRVLLGERLTARKLAGITISFSGLVVVVLLGTGGTELSVNNTLGVAIIMVGPLCWSIATVLWRPLMEIYNPVQITALSTLCGAAMVLPLLLVNRGVFSEVAALDWRGWFAVLVTTLLSVVIGYILWNRGLQVLEPTQVVVYIYLAPFFGVLFAWWLLGEPVTFYLLVGGVVIMAGIGLINTGRRAPPVLVDETPARPASDMGSLSPNKPGGAESREERSTGQPD